MIPQAYIIEWANLVPWQTNEQVEQDLVICRALVEIFSDEWLNQRLAFRGGTALNKLYLQPQQRYSEDIDLVQITAEPFGPIADRLRERLAFLGEPQRKQKEKNFTLLYRFESEFPPVANLRLKVETNCREHFTVLGYQQFPFQVKSTWFNGSCTITTYQIEELLGTKLRALYQRRKGRDLFDLYKAMSAIDELDINRLLSCYNRYMEFSVELPPTKKLFLQNIELKLNDDAFAGDIKALIRPEEQYEQMVAYEKIKTEILEIMK
jgi:predicted nucleotidyltransferase component of viral defense system